MDRKATFDITALRLQDYTPRPEVVLPQTQVHTSAVPSIDVHNHLGRWLTEGHEWMYPDPSVVLERMDATGIRTMVNLDGMWDEELETNLDRYDRAYPGRFLTFCQLDWSLLAEQDGVGRLLTSLEDSHRRGARGVKVWKNLGLEVCDASGALVLPDDPRVVAVLGRAGELGLPVLIHVADPKAFFRPLDGCNERIEELSENPSWWFGEPEKYPSFERLLKALSTLVRATSTTTYIGAHVGCCAEDLDWVEELLATAPNFHVDIAGRIAELGRQPRRFRALVERFPDRVLFGSDLFPLVAADVRTAFRFLETEDESFSYTTEAVPPQGRWPISGAGLTAPHLERVYATNAGRVLGI
ncbi:amidohydrolase family protein [Brachybacterium alimentarium]|uniref:amidohydrolase family protein n=1 Tax=Brachybacterium alimentarium TaxID=47845 RepID=UPI000DF4BB45|nr:amidohydrolase family protein [Brachybacterium alimentarium]RCS93445.1 amidohydrolase [Brachybacterium alimentarium]